jgi:glycosyltransferase involved in cell wall biosynthesis
MKVAVFHNLPTGGAKRVLHGFVSYLVRSDNQVSAFVPSTAREDYLPLKDAGAEVKVFPVDKTVLGSAYSFLRYLPPTELSWRDLEITQRRIAEAVDASDCDVVLCEQDQFTMSPFFLKYVKKPTAYFCQQPSRFNEPVLKEISKRAGRPDGLSSSRRWARRQFAKRTPGIDRRNAAHAKYTLVNSNFSKESVRRSYGVEAHVCYLGVDTGLFRSLNTPRERFVLSLGECAPKKGYDFLIRSLALIEPGARPRLVLICNSFATGWREYLERLAREKGVELEFKSLVGDDEVLSMYNRSQLVLCAAYNEPFGLTPVEAMACGTPVVAVREGGFAESVLDKETGFLTERSEESFARAVSNLLGDEGLRESMGKRGIDAVKGFWTLDHAGKRLVEHLDKVAASSGGRSP